MCDKEFFIREIQAMVAAGRCDDAIERLDHEIELHPDRSWLWMERGKVYWKLGLKANAISDYEEAVHLDPQSPARHALALARDVMDYYNPDLLNP